MKWPMYAIGITEFVVLLHLCTATISYNSFADSRRKLSPEEIHRLALAKPRHCIFTCCSCYGLIENLYGKELNLKVRLVSDELWRLRRSWHLGITHSHAWTDLHTITKELIEKGEFAVIDKLEGSLFDRDEKFVIHQCVARWGGNEARSLLRIWAIQYPDERELKPYCVNGIQSLMAELEDVQTPGFYRADAACLLLQSGIPEVTGFVRFYRNDETDAEGPHPSLIDLVRKKRPIETLGGWINRCIGQHVFWRYFPSP